MICWCSQPSSSTTRRPSLTSLAKVPLSDLESGMNHFTGTTIVSLMRAHGATIRSPNTAGGVAQRSVRDIRRTGVVGALDAWGWVDLIAGQVAANNIGATVARVYL